MSSDLVVLLDRRGQPLAVRREVDGLGRVAERDRRDRPRPRGTCRDDERIGGLVADDRASRPSADNAMPRGFLPTLSVAVDLVGRGVDDRDRGRAFVGDVGERARGDGRSEQRTARMSAGTRDGSATSMEPLRRVCAGLDARRKAALETRMRHRSGSGFHLSYTIARLRIRHGLRFRSASNTMIAARRCAPAVPLPPRSWRQAALAGVALMLATGAGAEDPPAVTLDPVVVTATRSAERSFDVPASVDTHRRGDDPARHSRWSTCRRRWCACPASSRRTAGTMRRTCRSASRGFGARAAFGVRGVRLYQDGIPATMPDGQGQTGQLQPVVRASSIEVLRGPFSTLYGNASGGVISVFTEERRDPPTLIGSLRRAAATGRGTLPGSRPRGRRSDVGYVAALSAVRDRRLSRALRGARAISSMPSSMFDTRRRETRLTLDRQHAVPARERRIRSGLTRAQWEADPRQADPVAIAVQHAQDDQPDARGRSARAAVRATSSAAR